jgi:hypothetical protein
MLLRFLVCNNNKNRHAVHLLCLATNIEFTKLVKMVFLVGVAALKHQQGLINTIKGD